MGDNDRELVASLKDHIINMINGNGAENTYAISHDFDGHLRLIPGTPPSLTMAKEALELFKIVAPLLTSEMRAEIIIAGLSGSHFYLQGPSRTKKHLDSLDFKNLTIDYAVSQQEKVSPEHWQRILVEGTKGFVQEMKKIPLQDKEIAKWFPNYLARLMDRLLQPLGQIKAEAIVALLNSTELQDERYRPWNTWLAQFAEAKLNSFPDATRQGIQDAINSQKKISRRPVVAIAGIVHPLFTG